MRSTSLRVLSAASWKEATPIGEVVAVLYLDSHWDAAIIRYTALSTLRLRPAMLLTGVIGVVQGRQILSVLYHKWRFQVACMAMSSNLLWVDIIVCLVLLLLLLSL